MKRLHLHSIGLTLLLSLMLPLLSAQPVQAQSIWNRLFGNSRPTNPTEEQAAGRARGGAIRDTVCSSEVFENPPLTVLVRADNYGRTQADHPVFYFHMPYTTKALDAYAEFMLYDAEFAEMLEAPIQVELPDRPGIVRFTMPETAPALEPGNSYAWTFSIVCDEFELSRNDYVAGWIERVPPDTSVDLTWHEAVDQAAQQRQDSPENWRDLLSLYGLEALADQPIEPLVPVTSASESDFEAGF